ncbi:hypothetical protein LUTEI9C_140266 [Luteimonas sp. 9C]|nr:hypothetical protein LUTEI9C_140266 [Luteimonas sp. 9C]
MAPAPSDRGRLAAEIKGDGGN